MRSAALLKTLSLHAAAHLASACPLCRWAQRVRIAGGMARTKMTARRRPHTVMVRFAEMLFVAFFRIRSAPCAIGLINQRGAFHVCCV